MAVAAVLLITLVAGTAPGQAAVTAPAGLVAAGVSPTQVRLQWTSSQASPAGSLVTKYSIFRGNLLVGESPASQLWFVDAVGLAPATTYAYRVRAWSSRNQRSALSTAATATTYGAGAPAAVAVLLPGVTPLPISAPALVRGFSPDATGAPFDWGFMQKGAFVEFGLSLQRPTRLQLTLAVASWDPGAAAAVVVNGLRAGRVAFQSQGSWSDYVAAGPVAVDLPAGPSALRVQDAAGVGFNLAAINLTASDGGGGGGGGGCAPEGGRKGVCTGIMRLGSEAAGAAEAAQLAGLGASWARSDFPWSEMEPSKGAYDTAGHDVGVRALVARGIRVLGIVAYCPPWANGGKDQFWPPSDPQDFGAFAGYLAARYGPLGVHHWEIWNEPNIQPFWSCGADPARYTQLLRAAFAAIKAADPNATVITGGLAPAASAGGDLGWTDFLQGVYSAGGGGFFDGVAVHPYSYPYMPDDSTHGGYWFTTAAAAVRAVMMQHGDGGKPLWLTEFGAPTGGPAGSGKVTEAVQAQMLTSAFALSAATPLTGPLFWYDFRDSGTSQTTVENFFGLKRFDGSEKPACAAMRAVPACL